LNSKQQILSKISNTLEKREKGIIPTTDFESPIYHESEVSALTIFENELKNVDGQFFLCENENHLVKEIEDFIKSKSLNNIFCIDPEIQYCIDKSNINYSSDKDSFLHIDSAITSCEYLIARTGSVMVSSKQTAGRKLNVFPPIHIVIARKSQLVFEISEAYENIMNKYKNVVPSMISIITGPSRTADIEKTLILGAHGPKEFIVFLLN
jgi:L-lactate dehydrogenase complex protein LldG